MKIAKEVEQIIETIEAAGWEAYVVGGSVRDALLGREPYDWDIATSASAETITGLFPRTAQIGAKFGIVKVLTGELAVDVAAYRIDGRYTDSRRPDEVFFTRHLHEDLQRRDFTMNAMAFSPKHGLIDPFGGQTDIAARIVRTVGDPHQRFREDALRILRGIRLAVQLNFVIEPETAAAMDRNAELLHKISIERIRDEFERILLSRQVGEGLRLCKELHVLPHILGDWVSRISQQEERAFDALLNGIGNCPENLAIRLGLLLLCFEKRKAETTVVMLKHSRPMEHKLFNAINITSELLVINSKPELKGFINRYGYKTYHYIESLISNLMDLGMDTIVFQEHGQRNDMRSTQREATESSPRNAVNNREDWIREISAGSEPVLPEDLAISGRDLMDAGIGQGREVGIVLEHLLAVVHRQPERNDRGLLLEAALDYKKEESAHQ